MNNTDRQYLELFNTIQTVGRIKKDRTGTGTKGIFCNIMRFLMSEGFPLNTLKKTHHPAIVHELLWFMNAMPEKYKQFGNTNIKYLVDNNCHIWNEWAYERFKKFAEVLYEPDYRYHVDDPQANCTRVMNMDEFVSEIKMNDEFALEFGELGPVYGKQWTAWEKTVFGTDDNHEILYINQLDKAIERLKSFPEDRGIIISAWNVSDLDRMALRPCHTLFQLTGEELTLDERWNEYSKGAIKMVAFVQDEAEHKFLDREGVPRYRLSMSLYQRSCDVGLGLPFNTASYSLMLHMIAQVTNMVAHEFVHITGDTHVYLDHLEKLDRINGRESFPLPKLKLNPNVKNITDFRFEDIEIIDYVCNKGIILPVAV